MFEDFFACMPLFTSKKESSIFQSTLVLVFIHLFIYSLLKEEEEEEKEEEEAT
jgi:hypothetical protein